MPIVYQVQLLHVSRQNWLDQLKQAILEGLTDLGLQNVLTVNLEEGPISGDAPSLVLILGCQKTKNNLSMKAELKSAIDNGLLVLPVVEDLDSFSDQIPDEASKLNAFEWSGDNPARRLARTVLEQLNIEDCNRRVFISHRRSDGLAAAEQLHDALTRQRFKPFIDRFSIGPGEDVQEKIADVLEDFAFLLLLETPDAHKSKWVYDEVEYALAHTMGVLIVRWPGNPEPVPGSAGLSRVELKRRDITKDSHGYEILKQKALDEINSAVEAAHARAIVRRRRNLLQGVQDSAKERGATCIPLKDWALDVTDATGAQSIVRVSPRLPTCGDLQQLDETRKEIAPSAAAQLIYAARHLNESKRKHLQWVVGDRRLEMIPENAIGVRK